MAKSNRPIIQVETLAAHLQDPEWVIVDCRFDLMNPTAGGDAYRNGHIAGAFYTDLDRDLAGPADYHSGGRHPLPRADDLARLFGSWGLTPGKQLVAYDDAAGAVAARLWWLLRWFGHERVAILDGGLQAWLAAGNTLDTAQPAVHTGRYDGTPGHMKVIDADGVTTGLAADQLILLDARAPARFRGQQEPLDPVAGHIPGAVNVPFQDNLTAEGRFRPAAELRAHYQEILASRSTAETACMCGSGVTACHTLIALEHAGLPGASLYVGSWSDWISIDARPIAME